ncbi:MAG: sugar transferase [Mogibacterium sp.]|nr:sugar transferase [Mogibacterium sp.]
MSHKPYGPYEKYVKRPLDCVLATGALIVLSPVMGATALAVRKNLGKPVLFSQERPGRIDQKTGKEKIFRLYKFRSMTDARGADGELLSDEIRLTDFGKFLRSTSLDELPELFNIIKGDMAIVGPRPLLTRYLPRYSEHQRRRHEVRPGLTGLAQVNGRNSVTWTDKFEWDIKYVDHISFKDDVKIIIKTILSVLSKEGINSDTSATMYEFMGTDGAE